MMKMVFAAVAAVTLSADAMAQSEPLIPFDFDTAYGPEETTVKPPSPKRGPTGHIFFDYYPEESVRKREEGIVIVALCVDTEGRTRQATLRESSGFSRLDQATLDVLERQQGRLRLFTPAQLDGKPVDYCDYPFKVEWKVPLF